MKAIISTVALAAALAHPALAKPAPATVALGSAWNLTLDGQLRARMVADSGKDFVDGDSMFSKMLVTQRARLGATVANEKGVGVTLRLQDVRVWGEEANTLNDYSANGLDAHEAFAVLPVTKHVKLKLGRQEVIFDDHRLVGNVGWTQRARSFDGARALYKREKVTASLFGVIVREDDRDGDGHFVDMAGVPTPKSQGVVFGGLHMNYKASGALAASLAYYGRFKDDLTGATKETRHTVGTHITGASAGVKYSGTAYYQLGTLGKDDIGAWMAAVRLGYTLKAPMSPSVTAWGEMLSGDGKPTGAFDTLYATNHKFYGEMDYILNVPAQTGLHGLKDLGGQLALKPHTNLKAQIAFHNLTTQEAIASGEKALGNEVDVKLIWSPTDGVAVRGLYGIFLPGDGMKMLRGLTDSPATEHFAYLTVDTHF